MDKKTEVQDKIIKEDNLIVTEEEFANMIKMFAPGTNLRSGLDGILKAKKGALILIENENTHSIIDGGFRINTRFTPQKLVELSKMDGAIILSKDTKKINYANVLLTPSHKIKTQETGTRHKAGERSAKQTGSIVIAVSERKNEINIFYKNLKYLVLETDELLRKVNEHIQFLDKQKELFNSHVSMLNNLELRNYPNLMHATNVIQKGYLTQKIAKELQKNIIELGKEGPLLKIRLREIIKGVDRETDLVIKDYTKLNMRVTKTILEDYNYDDILREDYIMGALGYEGSVPKTTPIKGWRILSKTGLLDSEIAEIVKEAETIGRSIHSNPDFYKTILGEEKAKTFQEELRKVKMNNLIV